LDLISPAPVNQGKKRGASNGPKLFESNGLGGVGFFLKGSKEPSQGVFQVAVFRPISRKKAAYLSLR
jgi:hypothetical protein